MLRDIRQTQALPLMKNHSKDAVSDWRWSNSRTRLVRYAGRYERLDLTVVADDGHRSVLRADEAPGLIDNFVQHSIERKRRCDVQTRSVQRQQLAILTLHLLVTLAH